MPEEPSGLGSFKESLEQVASISGLTYRYSGLKYVSSVGEIRAAAKSCSLKLNTDLQS